MNRSTRALAGLSLGLGLSQLAAPGLVARLAGLPDDGATSLVLRAVGVRELICGIGLLSARSPAAWTWARLGGDLIDLALLGAAMGRANVRRGPLAAALAAVAGVAALDLRSAMRREAERAGEPSLTQAVTINREPEVVYRFWRDLEQLPRFMQHLESVEVLDERRSRWWAKGPAGTHVAWEAEITDDQPGQRLAWRSLPGSQVESAGEVRFVEAPHGRGTEVYVRLSYSPPGAAVGALVAKLFREAPEQQIPSDLRRLKQVLETGDVVLSDGRNGEAGPLQRPAQPEGRRPRYTDAGLPKQKEIR